MAMRSAAAGLLIAGAGVAWLVANAAKSSGAG